MTLAALGSTVDVVVARAISNREVEAITPFGSSYGVFDGHGNINLYNGIRCLGVRSTSLIMGYVVDYGVCTR